MFNNRILVGLIFMINQLFQLGEVYSDEIPPLEIRLKMLEQLAAEIKRIDGDGLLPLKKRPASWIDIQKQLEEMTVKAKSPYDLGQVFRKLDAAYPNLHAQVVLNEKYDIAAKRLRPKISVRFKPYLVTRKQSSYTYRINSIETDMLKEVKETVRPAIGDILIAINGRSMNEWSKENFLFCKFPLKEQCELNIFDHFRKGVLSWDWRTNLEYTFKRNDRTWTLQIPYTVPTPTSNTVNVDIGQVDLCLSEGQRYKDFTPVHKGLNICAYESIKWPNTTVLRIASFAYRELRPSVSIQSLEEEVKHFYNSYWKAKAPSTKKLIIDLINNGGGDNPIPWYKIFYSSPFQETFVQYKKFAELENISLRQELFYNEGPKEKWFTALKAQGIYQKIKIGAFLPPVPAFCADENGGCHRKELFKPNENEFKGQVRLLTNEWCISSCTAMVWSIKDQLKKRVKIIGVPESGDSSHARLFLDLYLDSSNKNGFRIEVQSRTGRTKQQLPEGAFLRQQVTTTRTVDYNGRILSGNPTPVDIWVPSEYRHFTTSWEENVFHLALVH